MDEPALIRAAQGGSLDAFNTLVLTYQDTRGQFETFYPMLQVGVPMVAKQLAREGININASALPSTSAIAPHLLPTTSAARRTADGFEFVGGGPAFKLVSDDGTYHVYSLREGALYLNSSAQDGRVPAERDDHAGKRCPRRSG